MSRREEVDMQLCAAGVWSEYHVKLCRTLADEIDALLAELAHVKAESLRVVVGKQRCALSGCGEKFYIQPSCFHDLKATPDNIQADFRRHPDTTVLPVRLERWEASE